MPLPVTHSPTAAVADYWDSKTAERNERINDVFYRRLPYGVVVLDPQDFAEYGQFVRGCRDLLVCRTDGMSPQHHRDALDRIQAGIDAMRADLEAKE
jgi:hypothetical protein